MSPHLEDKSPNQNLTQIAYGHSGLELEAYWYSDFARLCQVATEALSGIYESRNVTILA